MLRLPTLTKHKPEPSLLKLFKKFLTLCLVLASTCGLFSSKETSSSQKFIIGTEIENHSTKVRGKGKRGWIGVGEGFGGVRLVHK